MKSILVAFLLFPSALLAQGSDWLLLLPKWEVGEERRLTITYKERITRNDSVISERLDSTNDFIEVLTASSNGFTLKWLAQRFRVDVFTDVPELQYAVDQILARTDSLTMEVKVHPAGRLRGLRNWDEVQSVYFAMFDYVGTSLKKSGIEMSNEEVDQMVVEMKNRVDQRVQVEKTALQPYETLFNAFNIAMHRDSVKRQEKDIPIDFANEPVPGELVTRIVELNDSIAVLQTQTTIYPETALKAINDYLKLREAMGEEPLEPLVSGVFSFEETNTCRFERMSGWWKEVTFKAHTQINETYIEQVVRYTFRE